MRASRNCWEKNRYPLAMEHRLTRQDCKNWMARNGYPTPPRSACLGCPYRSIDEWRAVKEDAHAWYQVVQYDKAIRFAAGMEEATYLHRSCKPIDEVDFGAQANEHQIDLWGNECDGMCGV